MKRKTMFILVCALIALFLVSGCAVLSDVSRSLQTQLEHGPGGPPPEETPPKAAEAPASAPDPQPPVKQDYSDRLYGNFTAEAGLIAFLGDPRLYNLSEGEGVRYRQDFVGDDVREFDALFLEMALLQEIGDDTLWYFGWANLSWIPEDEATWSEYEVLLSKDMVVQEIWSTISNEDEIYHYVYYDRKEERQTIARRRYDSFGSQEEGGDEKSQWKFVSKENILVGKTGFDCELYEHLTLEDARGEGGWYIGRFWLNENIPGQVVQLFYGWVDFDYGDNPEAHEVYPISQITLVDYWADAAPKFYKD